MFRGPGGPTSLPLKSPQVCSLPAPNGPSAAGPALLAEKTQLLEAWASGGGSPREDTDTLSGKYCHPWTGAGTSAATLKHPPPAANSQLLSF